MDGELEGLSAPHPVPDLEMDGLVAQWDPQVGVFNLTRLMLSPAEVRKLFAIVTEYELE